VHVAADDDFLIFRPDDVDLGRSPLRNGVDEPTHVLGAFNPGFARLPGGNLLLMVRVAEALRDPVDGDHARAIRWTPGGYVLDRHHRAGIDMDDPRQFALKDRNPRLLGLTSLSWLLPVELSKDAGKVVKIHYDKAIQPSASFMDYGVEDARISLVGGSWWMTVCGVSAERHCTAMYHSVNGLDYRLLGIVLDHQNKDMILFEGRPGGKYMALTRPLGECYFAYPDDSPWLGGPAINMAQSPDGLHWKPLDTPGIRARRAPAPPADRRRQPGRDLPDLPALLSGHEWRRHRRSQGHRAAARLSRRSRHRRDLALADLSLADGRLRL
jgi:predicted GH43/DUF377 family glycosyl hydrolase